MPLAFTAVDDLTGWLQQHIQLENADEGAKNGDNPPHARPTSSPDYSQARNRRPAGKPPSRVTGFRIIPHKPSKQQDEVLPPFPFQLLSPLSLSISLPIFVLLALLLSPSPFHFSKEKSLPRSPCLIAEFSEPARIHPPTHTATLVHEQQQQREKTAARACSRAQRKF